MQMYLNFSKWALFYVIGKISEQSLGPVKYPKFPRKRDIKRFEGRHLHVMFNAKQYPHIEKVLGTLQRTNQKSPTE